LIKSASAKLGENISVSRFVRFKMGEAALIEETAEQSAP
jgi:translation elongation factor EF-Ts